MIPSVHACRSIAKAQSLGAAGGRPEAALLWTLSKRELIEVALHLAAQTTAEPDVALAGGRAANGSARVPSAAERLLGALRTLRDEGRL